MMKLLVSVRDAAEAAIAWEEGADLVDVKEPARGSLGAADHATLAEIVARLDGQAPLSAALGELLEGRGLPAAFAGKIQFAKFGLAGCASRADWIARWQHALAALPRDVKSAAVAYADWRAAAAPETAIVLAEAVRLGCQAILLDTWDKSAGPLTAHLDLEELRQFVASARAAGLKSALAGSLGWNQFAAVLALEPDYLAVRGAVCAGGRAGQLDGLLVRRLVRVIHPMGRRAAASERRPAQALRTSSASP